MKKSQLRKLIRESIKSMMAEQSGASHPGKMCTLEKCDYNSSHGGMCIPNSVPNAVGDSIIFTWIQSPMGTNYVDYYNSHGHKYFIKTVGAPCNAVMNGVPIGVIPNTDLGPQGCPRCCSPNNWTGQGAPSPPIPGGACFTACSTPPPPPPPPTSGCDPNGPMPGSFNLSNWTNMWTNLPNFSNTTNPNQPCNFICQRKNQWTNQLANQQMGPLQTNMLECKLAEATNQYQIHNCNTSSANNCP